MVLIEYQLHSFVVDYERLEDLSPEEDLRDANVRADCVPVPVKPRESNVLLFLEDVPHRDYLSVQHGGRPEDKHGAVEVPRKNQAARQKPSAQLRQELRLGRLSFDLHLLEYSSCVEARLRVWCAVLIQANIGIR